MGLWSRFDEAADLFGQPAVLGGLPDHLVRVRLGGGAGELLRLDLGVLGVGANTRDLRFLVVDAHAYRPLASSNPGRITTEEFALAWAEGREALLLQNVGRALRGEPGKTVVLMEQKTGAKVVTPPGHPAPAVYRWAIAPALCG